MTVHQDCYESRGGTNTDSNMYTLMVSRIIGSYSNIWHVSPQANFEEYTIGMDDVWNAG